MGHSMPGWYDIYSLEDRTSKEDEKGILESKALSNSSELTSS
jgi:hypothetical protein